MTEVPYSSDRDLPIGKEYIGVPLDAATKAELIDLMARILVTVFKAEGERNDRSPVQFRSEPADRKGIHRRAARRRDQSRTDRSHGPHSGDGFQSGRRKK